MTATKLIIDLSKPEGQRESVVPLTEAELEDLAKAKAAQEAAEAEAQARAEARASALEKLAALGLTEDEIAALAG